MSNLEITRYTNYKLHCITVTYDKFLSDDLFGESKVVFRMKDLSFSRLSNTATLASVLLGLSVRLEKFNEYDIGKLEFLSSESTKRNLS